MRNSCPSSRGFTLIELALVVTVIGIVAAIAVPSMSVAIGLIQVRSGIDRVTSQIYLARITAVHRGESVRLVLLSSGGCVRATRIVPATNPPEFVPPVVSLGTPTVCLEHSGDSILVFNSRGMLKPPTRSIFGTGRYAADSVLLSIAGRVRRNY